MDKRKTTNGQTMIYKTLIRKQKIEKLVALAVLLWLQNR